jgi:hypothetical protein
MWLVRVTFVAVEKQHFDVHMPLSTMQSIFKLLPRKHSRALSISMRYCRHYETDLGLHMKCPDVFVRFWRNVEFIDRFSYNMKFDTNTSNRSRADTCRKTDRLTDGKADITKPVVDYRFFANTPEHLMGGTLNCCSNFVDSQSYNTSSAF